MNFLLSVASKINKSVLNHLHRNNEIMSTISMELFKFSWSIENVSIWDYDKFIESPLFAVEGLGNAAFRLRFDVTGEMEEYRGLYLAREESDDGPENVKLNFRCKMPESEASESEEISFEKGCCWGWNRFIKNVLIFKEDDWGVLCGKLNIECTILKACEKTEDEGTILKNVKLEFPRTFSRRIEESFGRTRLKSEIISVKWNIDRFSKLYLGEEHSLEILSRHNIPWFQVTIFLTPKSAGGEDVEMNIINLRKMTSDPTFVACKVSFDDASGSRIIKIGKHVFDSEEAGAIWRFPVLGLKSQLIPLEKVDFLPSDLLSLRLDFEVWDGVQFSEIEKTVYGSVTEVAKPFVPELSPVKEDYLALFNYQQICDVSLETSTRTISAHKFILCVYSSVFKAMFERGAVEKNPKKIQITDIGFETLIRFLACLYTERLEGKMDAQLAMELYFAADKYQVGFLKRECSIFLKKNLQVGNVCDVLSLADRHQDEDLMSFVRAFIRTCKMDVLDSKEWKALFDANIKPCAEVLQWLCKNSSLSATPCRSQIAIMTNT